MKKLLALILAALLALSLVACGNDTDTDEGTDSESQTETVVDTEDETTGDDTADDVKVMTYDEYAAAALESAVVIEAYVQATQSWWDNKITVYAQDENGGYFIYNLTCSEEDSAKLVPGTKIRVSGYKAEWSGEVEIIDATFEIVEGNWIATAEDVTALLGTDDLIKHQNKLVAFKGMTVEKVEYKNGTPGDDIYVTVSKDGASYDFCVEFYLTGTDTDVYKAVGELKAGDVVDVEGFLYWYNGVNTHITAVSAAK